MKNYVIYRSKLLTYLSLENHFDLTVTASLKMVQNKPKCPIYNYVSY